MSKIVIRSSRWKNLLYALIGVGMCIGGISAVDSGGDSIFGMLLIIVGVIEAFVFFGIALNRNPQIILDEEGVDLIRPRVGRLLWSEISMVYSEEEEGRYGAKQYVNIELVDPERLAERDPGVAAHAVDGKIFFESDGYEMTSEDIADAMMRLRGGLQLTPEQLDVSEVETDDEALA